MVKHKGRTAKQLNNGRNQRQRARPTGSKAGTNQANGTARCAMEKHAFEQYMQREPDRTDCGNYANDSAVIAAKPPAQTWLRRDNLEIRSPRKYPRKQGVKR